MLRCLPFRLGAGMTGLPQTQETHETQKPTRDRTTRSIGRHGPDITMKSGEPRAG
jgi:hypothetical protein